MTSAIRASLLRAKALYQGFVLDAPSLDDDTLEINGGSARVKPGGIGATELGTAEIVFGKLAVADKFSHPIYIGQVRGPSGLVTTATLASGVWAEVIAANVHRLGGELADANTKTSVGTVQFQLPQNYVAAGDVVVRISTMLKAVTDTISSNNGSDLDLEVYEQSKTAGTVGSDLNGTAAATYAAVNTMYQKDFVIDATGLVPGDLLNLLITGRAIETGSEGGTLQSIISGIEVLLDVYGSVS